MQSKFASLELALTRAPLRTSFLLHGFFALFFLGMFFLNRMPEKIEISILESPSVSTAASLKTLPHEMPKPQQKAIRKQAVFGASRKTLTEENGQTVKAGNTVAKTPDQTKLKTDDPDALPIPAEEFLVSKMPKLLSEVRIDYPPEAKRKGIQGAVVFDILIDAAGKVRDVKLIEGLGYGLDEAALAAIKGFSFEPASIEDKPVAVRIRYAYRFILERN